MLFEAYLDESGCDDQSKVLVVGGYLIEQKNARLMESRWNALLEQYKVPFFHMVDCAHGNKHFKGMPKEKRARFAQKLIELIGKRQSWGFVVACPVARHYPVKGYDPYTTGIATCAMLMQSILQTEMPGQSVTINIEAGHKSAPAAKTVLDRYVGLPDFSKLESYRFARKDQSVLLQAADILCWQVAKNIKNVVFDGRSSRRDYIELVGKTTTIFYQWCKEDRILSVTDNEPAKQKNLPDSMIGELFRTEEVTNEVLKSWEALPSEAVAPGKGPLFLKGPNQQPIIDLLRKVGPR